MHHVARSPSTSTYKRVEMIPSYPQGSFCSVSQQAPRERYLAISRDPVPSSLHPRCSATNALGALQISSRAPPSRGHLCRKSPSYTSARQQEPGGTAGTAVRRELEELLLCRAPGRERGGRLWKRTAARSASTTFSSCTRSAAAQSTDREGGGIPLLSLILLSEP